MSCPCCAIPTIALQLVTTALAVIVGQRWLLPSTGYPRIRLVIRGLVMLITTLTGILALVLIVLNNHSAWRSKSFSVICSYIGLQNSPLDAYRCPLLQNHTKGQVIEFGPGPGTNFRCFSNDTSTFNTLISNYVAVDPNPNFETIRQEEKERWNLTFPLVSVGLRGEDAAVENNVYDTVIGAHVLCSVDSPTIVLHAMEKALKPGGHYLFLEHVLAKPERRMMRWIQENIGASLLAVVADGCKFVDTASLIRSQFGDDDRFELELIEFDAPGVPPFVGPHIMGVVTKKEVVVTSET